MPDKQDRPNVAQPRRPNLQIAPNTLQLLLPQLRQKGNDVGSNKLSCPRSYVPDGNGGCVRG